MTQDGPRRPLLIHGERLKLSVAPPPSGGGQRFEPQSPEQAREVLLPMVQRTLQEAERLPRALRGDRLYVEARLLPNYLAASHFPSPLLAQVNALHVGSRMDEGLLKTKEREEAATTRRLILALTDGGLAHLQEIIERPESSRSASQAFQEIRKLDDFGFRNPATVVLSRPQAEDEIITWEAVLHPAGVAHGEPLPLDQATLEKWFALVENAGGESFRDFVREVGGLTFAPVRLPVATVDRVSQFNPLRAIRPMPAIRPFPVIGLRAARRFAPPGSTFPIGSSPRVAVFDGGVDAAADARFFPSPSVDLTTQPPDPGHTEHGTAVGASVMYGLATPGGRASPPPVPVDHYRVLPAPPLPGDLQIYWVLDRIKEVVTAQDYQLVNLSLGPSEAVEDSSEPNRWTSELDELAWERDVLFVVAGGNNGEEDQATGLHRVQVPGDMANGLAVGACDAPPPEGPWKRAPYSAMGPGRHGNRVQPAGLQFGGVDARPITVLAPDGSLATSCGTSYAAPLVTHALAELASRLPGPNASALRAFAIHFAERHKGHAKAIDEWGHGRFPLLFREHLDCGPDEIHVLFVDRVKRGEYLGYALPVPRDCVGPVEVELTLCYSSPVDPGEPTEYTRASLEMALRPHHLKHRFAPPPRPPGTAGPRLQPKVLEFPSDEATELLNAGWKMSLVPITKTLGVTRGRSEVALRDAGKWETVRHYRVRLAKGDVAEPRIDLAYVARRAGSLDNAPSEVPFALLITVRDREPGRGGSLYDSTVAQYTQLTRLPLAAARIQVRAR